MIRKIEINGEEHCAVIFETDEMQEVWELRKALQSLCSVAAGVVSTGRLCGADDLFKIYLGDAMRILEEMDFPPEEVHAAERWMRQEGKYREVLKPVTCKVWHKLESLPKTEK